MTGDEQRKAADKARREREREKRAKKKADAAAREKARAEADAAKSERIKERQAELAERRRKKTVEQAETKRRKEAERIERDRLREQAEKRKREVYRIRAEKRKKLYSKLRKVLSNRSDGFDYVNYGVLPRIGLEIRGDGASVTSRLCAAGIDVRDVVYRGGVTRLKIRKKDLRKAIAILNDLCYNFSVGDKYGVGKTAMFAVSRVGLAVGCVLAATLLVLSYNYVWRVSVSGNERLTTAAITSALTSSGINAGLKKSELDLARVSAVVNGIDGVSDASCEIVGTTLRVYVLESKEYVERHEYGAYYSAYDATVTRIVTRSGRAVVKRGEVVKQGELLVDGRIMSTVGEPLLETECDADVYGNVSLTFDAVFGSSTVEFKRTGNVAEKTGMRLFGHELFAVESPFDSYESESYTANYDVLIPLYVTHHRYYETSPVEVAVDPEEAAKAFARQKIEELCFVGQFDSTYTVTQSVSGLYSVHLFLSGETIISRGGDKPIYEQEQPQD